jgi:hypothetical protein
MRSVGNYTFKKIMNSNCIPCMYIIRDSILKLTVGCGATIRPKCPMACMSAVIQSKLSILCTVCDLYGSESDPLPYEKINTCFRYFSHISDHESYVLDTDTIFTIVEFLGRNKTLAHWFLSEHEYKILFKNPVRCVRTPNKRAEIGIYVYTYNIV